MLQGIEKILRRLNGMLGPLCGLGILAMGLILFYEVVSRYFFNAPTIWASEVAVYIFMWTMFCGAAYTLQEGKHVHIDLLLEHLPLSVRRGLRFLTSLAGTAYCALVTHQGWGMVAKALKYNKHSPTPLHVPMVVPLAALVIGFALLTLQFAFMALTSFSKCSSEGGEVQC